MVHDAVDQFGVIYRCFVVNLCTILNFELAYCASSTAHPGCVRRACTGLEEPSSIVITVVLSCEQVCLTPESSCSLLLVITFDSHPIGTGCVTVEQLHGEWTSSACTFHIKPSALCPVHLTSAPKVPHPDILLSHSVSGGNEYALR